MEHELFSKRVKIECPEKNFANFAEFLQILGFKKHKYVESQRFRFSLGDNKKFIEAPEHIQGFSLLLEEDGASVQSNAVEGLFNGAAELSNIIFASTGGMIDKLEFSSLPDYDLRIYQDDISRKQVSRLSDFKRILRNLARWKINAYSLYIEDMLEFKSFPDIGCGRGRLTQEEIREIHCEAEKYHIRIIPLICLLGHSENILSIPEFSDLGRKVPYKPSSYDVANSNLRPFLSKIIKEAAELFPDEYFHGGFDEVRGLSCEEFCSHVEWVASELKKYGKKLVIYYDMFINHFGHKAAEQLSDEIILANWNYETYREYPGQKDLSESIHEHWVVSGMNNWCKLATNIENAYMNISALLESGVQSGASAAVLAAWGDDGHENQRDANWNMIAYFGSEAWGRKNISLKSFLDTFHLIFYGHSCPELAEVLIKMGNLSYGGQKSWSLWHGSPYALERLVKESPELYEEAQKLEDDIIKWGFIIEKSAKFAVREIEHFDQYRFCLKRIKNLNDRILLAGKLLLARAKGKMQNLYDLTQEMSKEIRELKIFYRNLWLRHNRLENIEFSLTHFVRLENEYIELYKKNDSVDSFDLTPFCNEFPLEISGVPMGSTRFCGDNYWINEIGNFSILIKAGISKTFKFEKCKLKDMKLLFCASDVPENYSESLNFSISCEGKEQFSEKLKNRRHIADWYAPLGDIWAGSSTYFIDKKRVKLAWEGIGFPLGGHFGIYILSGFSFPPGMIADSVRFDNIDNDMKMHILGMILL